MESISSAIKMLFKHCFMVVVDLKDAYYHVPIHGNFQRFLRVAVPELSGFLLLTFLIQMPLILFLLTDEQIVILPLEFAVHTIYIIFLNFELLVSFFALKIMTQQLATQFYLQSTDDLEAKALTSKVKTQQSTYFMTEQQKKNALMY
ncbi:unnamed protein product [Ranitomeya imitator]|uniref:Reverse transcriptase domain-containing protein n=1 Tax=Ranitomeya imitator TaxID=111125 RepID=A0ABN9L3P7_9NEOB|nr:unnamed protein product [Ranitomeya imitator]